VGQIFIPKLNVGLFQEEIAPVFDWHNVGKGLRHTREPLTLLGFWIYSYICFAAANADRPNVKGTGGGVF
jgi:hypothetical protein